MYRQLAVVPLLALLAAPCASLAAEDPAAERSIDNLELVESDRRGKIYAAPGVDWSTYQRIKLDDATVAFRKNWQRDQNRSHPFRIRAEDMERIKHELSGLFGEVFAEELSGRGGYVITNESAEDVLRVTPHIVDLDVYAPDSRNFAVRTRSYTEQAGRMTLKLELYDSVTGALIARASDRKEAPRRGYLQWTTSATNRAEARRIIQQWADEFRERLNQARSPGTATTG